jgi:hypothetical protein
MLVMSKVAVDGHIYFVLHVRFLSFFFVTLCYITCLEFHNVHLFPAIEVETFAQFLIQYALPY